MYTANILNKTIKQILCCLTTNKTFPQISSYEKMDYWGGSRRLEFASVAHFGIGNVRKLGSVADFSHQSLSNFP